ncbi:MAG: DUF3108 domain-containing protein, partial [Pyrinomonadaceae bacterium]
MKQSLKLAAVCSSLFMVLALMGPASAQSKGDITSLPFSTAPYRVGERLTYNVSFSNFISAAHVELQVAARGSFLGREGVQLRAHVETTGVINAALFAINNDYVTYVDPATGLPFHAQQVVRESSRTSDTARDFNQRGGEASLPPSRTGLSSATYDFLSAIYRVRASPLNEGATYYFSIKSDNEDYQAELKVTGRQTVKTNVGSFNAIATQVHVTNNSRANNYRLRIYFSDDERHVPVLATARLSAGEIRAELAGSEFVKPAGPTAPPTASNTPAVPAAPAPVVAPTPAGETGDSSLDHLPFKVGEQLTYQVFLANIPQPAGTATFHVRARSRFFDRDGLHFAVRAQTTNAAQRMFFANDQISSYVDPKTMLPYRTEMNLIEGNRRLNQILTINQDYGAATSDKGLRIEVPVGTHDYISVFYLARTFNLAPGKRNGVSILVNNKPKTLFITSVKRETIQLGSENIPAIQLSLTTDDPQSDKFQLRAWISDDKRRLPLRLTAMTELG